jgi:hypothetical protein
MKLPTTNTLRFAVVAHLSEDVRHVAGHVVARARAARRHGATADAYRISAEGLDEQAGRAEALLFNRAVETFRAAAAENRLIADALEVLEGRTGL